MIRITPHIIVGKIGSGQYRILKFGQFRICGNGLCGTGLIRNSPDTFIRYNDHTNTVMGFNLKWHSAQLRLMLEGKNETIELTSLFVIRLTWSRTSNC